MVYPPVDLEEVAASLAEMAAYEGPLQGQEVVFLAEACSSAHPHVGGDQEPRRCRAAAGSDLDVSRGERRTRPRRPSRIW